MIDSHCHLEMFGEEVSEVIKRAEKAGVTKIISVASDPESLDKILQIAEKNPIVYATAGIHPHEAVSWNEELRDKIFEFSRHPKVVAIGEIGLDYHYNHSPKETQQKAFKEQLEVANELGLPVVIHSREAFEDTFEILKSSGIKRGVMHCFSGDVYQAQKAIELGMFISISGVVTFKNSKKIKEVARFVPDEYLLVETDAPYLAPEPFRGRKNEPALLKYTVQALAELREVSFEDIQRITTINTMRLFQIGETPKGEIAYKIRDSLYLNITNRCTNVCKFCVRFHTDYVKGHNLRLENEPSVEDLIRAIENPKNYREIVFCGYGEPFLRLDVIKEVAKWIKEKGGRVRVNTNGHGNIIHGRRILPELKGLIDSISISLNAQDRETYNKICKPMYPNAYEAVIDFIKDAKENVPYVQVTLVNLPEIDIDKCREIANSLGVKLKIRHLDKVG
ncbi:MULTISPECIES: TatD family hydrolase [Thermodesulfovibrio]|jgi:TatD DNase family protein|uniref:TatD family hydrolase n=1 Tax=Thermodesulfovibrio TaxID=28261 RepID=UPI002610FB62|nr:TatD family hydrolase [Thermodesulfovibrio sp.]